MQVPKLGHLAKLHHHRISRDIKAKKALRARLDLPAIYSLFTTLSLVSVKILAQVGGGRVWDGSKKDYLRKFFPLVMRYIAMQQRSGKSGSAFVTVVEREKLWEFDRTDQSQTTEGDRLGNLLNGICSGYVSSAKDYGMQTSASELLEITLSIRVKNLRHLNNVLCIREQFAVYLLAFRKTGNHLFKTGRKLKATNAMHGIISYMFTVSETYKARTMT